MTRIRLLALAAAVPLFAVAAPASAASSYDACTGFIPSLPVTITTQGVWCFNKDLSTAIASGTAITVATNNVTIDCNGFKLGGLAAGPATQAAGIRSTDRSNITVRDCTIRGFLAGVSLDGELGGGHQVERNRFEGNTGYAIGVQGTGTLIDGNQVVDTGGSTGVMLAPFTAAVGVTGQATVEDNLISGVDGQNSGSGMAVGLFVGNPTGTIIAGNRVSGLLAADTGMAIGLLFDGEGPADVRDNTFGASAPGPSVQCETDLQYLHANALLMGPPGENCSDGGENYGWEFGPVTAGSFGK